MALYPKNRYSDDSLNKRKDDCKMACKNGKKQTTKKKSTNKKTKPKK